MSSGATEQPLLALLAAERRTDAAPSSAFDTSLSDEHLLLRAERGDRPALELLFDRYSTIILGIGLRVLRDKSEAEDLVQEVFLRLCGKDKDKGFDPRKGAARTWIVQMAYCDAFDRRAYLGRRHFYDGTNVEAAENTQQGGSNTEDRLATLVTGDQLHAAFSELNEKQRATLEMYFFGGFDFREISKELDETLENTRHLYYRGLERLRKSTGALGRRKRK